jgi:8-oxo-dGTP pyrophosphatase MutT (NUDIX family)
MFEKIFVNEKPIYLADHNNNRLQQKINEGFSFYDNNTNVQYKKIVNELLSSEKKGAVILQKDLGLLKQSFFNAFKIIEAGGGIVQNEQAELLFIFRRGKWDLPKGKLEKGETIEICAQREVEEETGVTNLLLEKKVGETYHIYQENNEYILKTSHWFHFRSTSVQRMKPQIEEDIAEVKWVAAKNINVQMENTYNNIKEILAVFFDSAKT